MAAAVVNACVFSNSTTVNRSVPTVYNYSLVTVTGSHHASAYQT